MTLARVKQLPVENLRSPNPSPINFNTADLGNFGPNFRYFNQQHSPSKVLLLMKSCIREAGSLFLSIFSTMRQDPITNFWKEVRWRSPMQSNVSRLDRLNTLRD